MQSQFFPPTKENLQVSNPLRVTFKTLPCWWRSEGSLMQQFRILTNSVMGISRSVQPQLTGLNE